MIISISSPYGSGCSGRDSTLFHLVLSLCRCTGISVNKRDFSFQSKSPTLLSPCRVFAYLSVSRNPVTCGLTRIGRAQTKMHKTPEKVLSHIPGPVTGLAREKRIAEGTAGPLQPGYEVTGMQSTISDSPPHESSANRNHEGTATYSSAPVVLRPAYMGGQAKTAGESTRPPVPGTTSAWTFPSGPPVLYAGERTPATWERLTPERKSRPKGEQTARRICRHCYQDAVDRERSSAPPLPGVIDTSGMERVSVSIGRCSVPEPAVWLDRQSGVRLCEGCRERSAWQD